MPHVRRQRDEVTRDGLATCRACLQGPGCECVTKIVNSAWPRPRGGDPCEPNHAAECVVHHAGGNSSVCCRKEHVVVRHGQLAAPIEVAVERVRHRRVQGDESALPELCPPDQQNAVGLQVIEPQIERLRDAQARCGDQPEERRVHLASEWVCPSQSAGGLDDLRHLLGRVDVGQWADLRSGKQG